MGLEETNILFIEDDVAACKSLPPILKSYGFKVNTANTFSGDNAIPSTIKVLPQSEDGTHLS